MSASPDSSGKNNSGLALRNSDYSTSLSLIFDVFADAKKGSGIVVFSTF